jgi:2'-5' RNA ligase
MARKIPPPRYWEQRVDDDEQKLVDEADPEELASVESADSKKLAGKKKHMYTGSPEEKETAYWLAEVQPSGDQLMVGLYLPDDAASQLAVPSGQSASSLHLTLALIDWTDKTALDQVRVIAAIDRCVKWTEPIAGTISGYGRFVAPDPTADGAQDVFYASFDAPGLVDLRQSIVGDILEAGYCVSTDHDFTPHITLSYLTPGSPNPSDDVPTLSFTFPAVSVSVGDYRVDVPFYQSAYVGDVAYSQNPTVGESVAVRALFAELKQEWIAFLPKPGKYFHRVFGNLDLTAERYARILANFDNNVYGQDLPISAEHDSKAVGAVGWIRPGGMRIASDGSLEVKPDWNGRGQLLIEDNRFQYVSAEFFTQWQDPVSGTWHEDVAVGHTICVRPHFKTNVLQPLAASEEAALTLFRAAHGGGSEAPTAPIEGVVLMDDDKDLAGGQDAGAGAGAGAATTTTTTVAKTPAKVTLNDAGFMDIMTFAEEKQQLLGQIRLAEDRARQADERTLAAEAKVKTVERERLREWAAAEVLGRSEDNGLRWMGDPEKHIGLLVSLATAHGKDSDEVQYVVAEQRNKRNAIEKSGIFREVGHSVIHGIGETMSEVDHLAKQMMEADTRLTKEQAVAKIFSDNPDMYDRYNNAGVQQQSQFASPV